MRAEEMIGGGVGVSGVGIGVPGNGAVSDEPPPPHDIIAAPMAINAIIVAGAIKISRLIFMMYSKLRGFVDKCLS
jgi:hypothetical protein